MAHEITATDGLAYRGALPWHGLGAEMMPGESLDAWRVRARLMWDAIKCLAHYRAPPVEGEDRGIVRAAVGNYVLARSDNGEALGIVSDRYQPVQPGEIVEFYRDLCEANEFQLETMGSLRGGRRVWALAKTPEGFKLAGGDVVKGYVLLATSYDGTGATTLRYTSVRVVCANTLRAAEGDAATVSIRHNTKFNANAVKLAAGLHNTFGEFAEAARTLSTTRAHMNQVLDLWMLAFHGKTAAEMRADEKTRKQGEKLLRALVPSFKDGPGAMLESANETLWGAVNAVTHHVDHAKRARSPENRFDASQWGIGDAIKRNAWNIALRIASGEKVAA